MEEKRPEILTFTDEIRQKIIANLKVRDLGIGEEVTLINGFINQPFNKKLSNDLVIGGPTIPMIILVGNTTGRVYLFALKAILNDERGNND